MPQITIRLPSAKGIALAVVVIVVLALLGGQHALRLVGRFLVREDALVRSDAIVVTAAGRPDRILEAVDLYEAGYADRMIWCREPLPETLIEFRRRGIEIPESAEVYRDLAMRLGVPSDAIQIVEHRVSSTHEEAAVLASFLAEQRIGSVLVVTTSVNSRRQCGIVEAFLPASVQLRCRPSQYDAFDPDSWWHDRKAARELVMELLKLVNYHLIERWTKPPGSWNPEQASSRNGQADGSSQSLPSDAHSTLSAMPTALEIS